MSPPVCICDIYIYICCYKQLVSLFLLGELEKENIDVLILPCSMSSVNMQREGRRHEKV